MCMYFKAGQLQNKSHKANADRVKNLRKPWRDIFTYYLSLITYYLLLITYYLLLITFYLLLIIYHIIYHPYNGGNPHCTFPVITVAVVVVVVVVVVLVYV